MLNRLQRLRRRLVQRRALGRKQPPGTHKAEVQEVLRLARLSFVQFQAAWDRSDLDAIGNMAMAPLLDDLRLQLAQRGDDPNHTEVVQLDARLLALEDLSEALVASVEFSGVIRERVEAPGHPASGGHRRPSPRGDGGLLLGRRSDARVVVRARVRPAPQPGRGRRRGLRHLTSPGVSPASSFPIHRYIVKE